MGVEKEGPVTARMSTPIQAVARINPERHESFDRSVIGEVVYGKKRKKKHRPIYAIHCHFLPHS